MEINWSKFKTEYVKDVEDNPIRFFKSKYPELDPQKYKVRLSRFKKDKLAIKNRIIEKEATIVAKNTELDLERLSRERNEIVNMAIQAAKENGNVRDFEVVWKMLKVELGEDTNITKNRNENLNVNLNGLSDEERDTIRRIIDSTGKEGDRGKNILSRK